ncbi:class I SAM-dependent methyltransferase [candidate division KSB1 bacterium]|nr:class I SAM-dependent methyltransferase [candidate division KSB1 bacterium]
MVFLEQNAAFYADLFPVKEPTLFFLQHFSGRILDVGCGPGLYSKALFDLQRDVVGIDDDLNMIDFAQQNHPQGTYLCLDMRDIDLLSFRFNMVFAIGNVLSFLKPLELPKFIRKLAQIIEPDGYWIFQVVNWDYLLTLQDHRFPDLSGRQKPLKLIRRYTAITESVVKFQTELFLGDNCINIKEIKLFPQKMSDYIDIHSKLGFSLTGCYADFTKTAFSEKKNSAAIYVFKKEM